jgi:hypothetical protein
MDDRLRFAELITYREIIGEEPTLTGLHTILKKYQRREVIFLFSKLNCLLGTWENTPKFDLDVRFSDYLLSDFKVELQKIRSAKSEKVAFSRLSILFLVKQACLACPEDGLPPNTRSAHSDMGVCVLMANDLLLPFVPSPSDDILKRMANLLPFADYISHDEYAMEIGRSQTMFNSILDTPALTARSDFLDIRTLFQDSMGLDQETFCGLVFACASKFLNVKLEELEKNPELAVIRNTYFDKSKISPDKITKFFSKMTCTETALVTKMQEWKDRPKDDLTLFQAYPLLEIAKDIHACLDPGFLVDKAGRSLYWTLFSETPPNQRGKLSTFWGAVFENYVNQILKVSYSAGGTMIPEPQFSNGDAAFDACIVEGRNLLVFEHKSSVIRADAKYGGDVSKLKAELDLKFIEGDADGKKGLSQLSSYISRFLGGDNVGGVSAQDINRIYPVLVCLESTMLAPYLGRYINERFNTVFSRRNFRQVVTPVFILGISDVENLLGYLQSFALTDIFESYHSKNKSMLTSISRSEVPLLKNVEPERNIVRERYSEFADRMEQAFFGEVHSEPNDLQRK